MPLIDSTYFDTAERNIPNTGAADVLSLLNSLIASREKEYLVKVLGYELYKAFWVGISSITPAQRFMDILLGVDFTGRDGLLKRWEGLISIISLSSTVTVPLTSADDIFFTVDVGTGPADNDDTYFNSSLAGLDYRVTQRGFGPLEPLLDDDSNIDTADIQINPSGGFTWLGTTRFNHLDKYQIELLSAVVDVSGYDSVTIPDSPIADYVYYWYLVGKVNHVSGTGQVQAKNENSVIVSSAPQQVRAWNNMVEKTRLLKEFLEVNYTVYPEHQRYQYSGAYWSWWGEREGLVSSINEFGI